MKKWRCEECKIYYLTGNKGKIYPAESEEHVDHKCTRKNDWFIECIRLGVGSKFPDYCDTFDPCSIYDLMKVQAIKNDM